jgi:hypothetical protein
MANLKPFRDYDEHDVINLFAVNAEALNKGSVVVAENAGINFDDPLAIDDLSVIGNAVSAKFNVPWTVAPAPSGATKGSIVGLTLKDVKRFDENGEQLIFNPRKAAEMDVVISGQACPIVTKGIVLVGDVVGNPGFGSGAAVSDAGDGSVKVVAYGSATVGKFLGPKNSEGYALLKIEL